MSSPLETQLGHDLRELTSLQPFEPDLESIGRRARQRHRRGVAVRGFTAAGAAILVAGGLFAAVHGTGSGAARPVAGRTPGAKLGQSTNLAPQTETVAYVAKQVKAAIASVDNYISYSQSTSSGVTIDDWLDPRNLSDFQIQRGTGGKSISWETTYLVHRVLTWKTVQANYSTRTWFVSVIHAAGPVQGSTDSVTGYGMTPQHIRAWLDSGQLRMIGTREINGLKAYGLRGPLGKSGYQELWVDTHTFLPLRTIVKFQGMPLRIGSQTWLPRTTSLTDMVNHVRIPAGFTRVAPPQ